MKPKYKIKEYLTAINKSVRRWNGCAHLTPKGKELMVRDKSIQDVLKWVLEDDD